MSSLALKLLSSLALLALAMNCAMAGHGQKYAIFESADDSDKKEPTDGAKKRQKTLKFQFGPPCSWTVDTEN